MPDYAVAASLVGRIPGELLERAVGLLRDPRADAATQILEDGNRMPGARWFVDARFNYAENLLRRDDDTPAIIFRNERGQRRELSWRAAAREVARIADGLRAAGVQPGDRVAGYLPNIPETVIAMLADDEPRRDLVFVLAGFRRERRARPLRADHAEGAVRGRRLSLRRQDASTACRPCARSSEKIASIERVVLVPYSNAQPALDTIDDTVAFADFGSAAAQAVVRAAAVRSSGLHPVFLRHDRRAEVHRARRRRRAAAADEGTHAALGHGAGRSLLLFHDLRLGDVERARERPRDRRDHRAVRRRTVAAGSAHAVAHGARRAHHDLRHQPALPGRLRAGGHPAARASSI